MNKSKAQYNNLFNRIKYPSNLFTCKYLLIALLLLGTYSKQTASAQEFNYYTQYMFNGFAINPAYAGMQEHITITGNIRSQWLGINGGPETQTVSAHLPIFNNQCGVGVMILNDKLGASNRQDISASYSYKIGLKNARLSFGLKLGFNTLRNNFSGLNLDDESDERFLEDNTAFIPILGFGAYYKTDDYYAGLAIPHLHQFMHNKYDQISLEYNKLVLISAGYLYRYNDRIKVQPSILAKTQLGSVTEVDINANMIYKDDYSVGISYKSLNSISLLFEIGIQKTYYIGYSYDVATTGLFMHQAGSHEFSLNVYLSRKIQNKVHNPRFF